MLNYSQVFVLFFSTYHFLIDDTATTKKWLSPDSSFGRVSDLTAITLMQENFCFGGILVSFSVRFAFARLGSALVGSGRAKNQAEIICIRRYGTAVY